MLSSYNFKKLSPPSGVVPNRQYWMSEVLQQLKINGLILPHDNILAHVVTAVASVLRDDNMKVFDIPLVMPRVYNFKHHDVNRKIF